jgi:pimeloyl-ACP methyl ester carboxylesterase
MNNIISLGQKTASREGVKLWRHGKSEAEEAISHDFAYPNKVVLLIHGFTATAEDMVGLAAFLQQEGSGCTVINCTYPCFSGIDRAATAIAARLNQFSSVISENRVCVVAHSMGGLVARALVSLNGGDRFVRGVITLGTPHLGTLKDRIGLNFLLELMSQVKKVALTGPYFPDSLSGKQLIGTDKDELLERLRDAPGTGNVRWVSFSGGRPELEFGSNKFKNILANWYIQKSFNQATNDGLVEEASSAADSISLSKCMSSTAIHIGKNSDEFTEHSQINHSALVNNGWTKNEVLKHINKFFP